MIVYLSGLQEGYFDFVKEFNGFGVLASFAYSKEYFKYLESKFDPIMLDSGAFSVHKGKTQIDREAYIRFIKENKVKIPINLDVLGNDKLSFENWEYISKQVWVMPVYHFNDDISHLHTYIEKSDYVGLSATDMVAQNQMRVYLDKIFSWYSDHKFHLFGCASIPILTTYPVYSADSTSWQNGTRMGWVITRYGNFFLNNNRNVPDDVEEFLRNKYGLLRLNEYESPARFGEEINKVNITELNYLLCHRNVEFTKSTNIDLF